MYKITGIIWVDGDMVVSSIRCNSDPYVKASKMGFTHGWIEKGGECQLIAVIDDDGNIQEV